MSVRTPSSPKIYHITHVENLAAIAADGALFSDAELIRRGTARTAIGLSRLKERRLRLPVDCHAGTSVGEYVPFYFCPRSVMLYLIHRGNTELAYRGGQGPIVHLEADLREAVAWAESERVRWAFTLSNAATYYTRFRRRLDQLDEVNWAAVAASDWRATDVKEGKQAEFLLHRTFPWHLVSRIGVVTMAVRGRAVELLAGAAYAPRVEVIPQWYY